MARSKSSTALEVSGLSFSYPDRLPLIIEMNISVEVGERVGIIGPNGAGKTTLFMLICGVLKPASGSVHLFGTQVKPGKFYPEVGMVFQNPDDQLFCPSVKDDVAFAPQNLGLSKKEVEERVQRVFDITMIRELADIPPHHLSSGEKRMVSIAGIMAMCPELVIYDEPTSNLDIRYRRRLINFLLNARETMLIASHDLEFILEVCSRVILLDRGEVVADGDPKDVMSNVEVMEKHGLERPHSLLPHAKPHHS